MPSTIVKFVASATALGVIAVSPAAAKGAPESSRFLRTGYLASALAGEN
jgi:hypothetical protein